jgi:hypothetical protein
MIILDLYIVYDWYLFFANEGRYVFKHKEKPENPITISANSYDEAKELLLKFIQSENNEQ